MSDSTIPVNSADDARDDGWDRGWDEHKRRQLIRMSKLTLAQKIQWLEDIQIIFEKLSDARKTATDAGKSSGEDDSRP